eukprot:gene21384-24258_t
MDDPKTVGLTLFGIAAYSLFYARLVAKPLVLAGNDEIKELMKQVPALNSVYFPPPYLWHADFQLIPYTLKGMWYKHYPNSKWYRQMVRLTDGEEIALDWVVSSSGMAVDGLPSDPEDETPVLMLHHGAFCNSADMPGQDYVQEALRRGWFVCALNRRGHAGPLTRPKWNFFGCPDDVHCVTQSILQRRPKAKLFTIGLSAGSGLVATVFGKGDAVNDFHAGVCVCPGFDITKCMGRFANFYADMLLKHGKKFFLKVNKALLEHLPGYHDCLGATDLQEWIDHAYAMAGCESKEHYYETYNPVNYVYQSTRPVLSICSENDPLCVVENFYDNQHRMESCNSPVGSILTKTGSHLPFYEGLFLGNWAEKVSFQFFDAYLKREEAKLSSG